RKLARLMGGDIRVTSKFGIGSQFQFSLPVRTSLRKPAPPVHPKTADDHKARTKHLRKVLGMDERKDTYEILCAALKSDYELIWASTGAEGLNFAEIHK